MKAKSIKQIKNSLATINVLDKQFKKAVIDTFGEIDGIIFEKISSKEDNGHTYNIYHVYDEKDGAEKKDFNILAISYMNDKNNKLYTKIIRVY